VSDPQTPPGAAADARRSSTAHRVAGALTLLEAVVLVGFVLFYVIESALGQSSDLARAAVSSVLILAFGVGLLVLARGWFRTEGWPKTPTVLWNVLLLPVAWSLRESAQVPLALAVGVVALAAAVAAVAAPRAPRTLPGEQG
jgi:hypothetical protein